MSGEKYQLISFLAGIWVLENSLCDEKLRSALLM